MQEEGQSAVDAAQTEVRTARAEVVRARMLVQHARTRYLSRAWASPSEREAFLAALEVLALAEERLESARLRAHMAGHWHVRDAVVSA